MDTEIKQICSGEEILDILCAFSSSLTSLSSGRVDRKEMAAKLERYGVVLELRDREQRVGFAAFYCNDMQSRRGFLTLIAVSPERKRRGYGKMLLDAVKTRAGAEGMTELALEVRKDNVQAISFYRKNGFDFLTKETEHSCFMGTELHA